MDMEITKCDVCGEKTLVVTKQLMHPSCILVLCRQCAKGEQLTINEVYDENSHHIVGVKI